MWGGVRKPQTRDRQGSDLTGLDRGVQVREVIRSDAEVSLIWQVCEYEVITSAFLKNRKHYATITPGFAITSQPTRFARPIDHWFVTLCVCFCERRVGGLKKALAALLVVRQAA